MFHKIVNQCLFQKRNFNNVKLKETHRLNSNLYKEIFLILKIKKKEWSLNNRGLRVISITPNSIGSRKMNLFGTILIIQREKEMIKNI